LATASNDVSIRRLGGACERLNAVRLRRTDDRRSRETPEDGDVVGHDPRSTTGARSFRPDP
jgi:hypothetical protein